MKRLKINMSSVFFIVILISCAAASAAAFQIREIRIADSSGNWGAPNPYHHYPRGPGYIRMSWVFDTLIWKGRNGYIPAIAQSWSFDADKQAFTFNLNPKAKWHDGRPLISEDVVFTLAYFKKHPYHWISVDKVSRAEAKGLHTVIVYLSKPYAPFLPEIGGTMPVLPKHIWEFVENPEMFNTPQAFIGSGPYRFRDFNKARGTYLYEAFADYYQGPPKADRLIYVRSGKPLISLVTGEVDMAAIQADMAEPLRQNGMIVIKDERGWNRKLMINHRKPPFDSRQFRQALAYAINQKEIIDKAHRGFGTRASYGLLSIDHEMYNPDTPAYPYDTDKAVKIIEFLGYRRSPHGFFSQNGRPLTVELLVSNNIIAGQSVADRDGEVIQKQLEAVGIRVDLVNMEQTTMDTKLKQWKFDLAVSGHGGISGDPRILSEMISSRYGAGSVNSARYDENTELNRLLEEQMREMDPEKRKAIVFKIQELYAWDLPAISLYYPESMTAYAPGKGIEWFYTKGGIGKGIPIAQNKISLIN